MSAALLAPPRPCARPPLPSLRCASRFSPPRLPAQRADITALTAIDLVLATSPDLPLVLQLTTEYLPDEISYFGNFTTDYLREQLAVHGVDERALVDNNLYLVVRQNATTGAAIAGAVNANAIADFVEEAPGPDSGEDFGSSVTADVVYVAQMQNSSVPLFESGFTEMSGTGTMLLQDMDDGTYEWTLDLDDRESQRCSTPCAAGQRPTVVQGKGVDHSLMRMHFHLRPSPFRLNLQPACCACHRLMPARRRARRRAAGARHPKKLEIRYFAKLNYQPIVLTLVADPKLEDKVVSYAGSE